MSKQVALLLLLLAAVSGGAGAAAENWVEVRSSHFIVLTDSNEKQGRHIADQFERMRSVFHVVFPKANVDPGSPIIVIAVKDKKGFQALEPEAYLAKGQLQLSGLFLHAPDKNYILLRLDVQEEHPYATVYHEYTHLMMAKAAEWLPLWLNEGLAEFLQNTEIHDKDVQLGQASADDILYLRQNRLLPLATLLTVDVNSPYYHEEQKGSVFYAESWALTHYLQITDTVSHTRRLSDYAELMSQHQDSVAAAQRAFGDLNQLQKALASYVGQGSFKYFKIPSPTDVDDTAFKVRTVTLTEADAVRADFLAYNQRTKDARALLDTILRDDPNNVSAHETMGYLEFREGNLEAARKWYEQAVKLDSHSYLAHYYFATISMRGEDSNPSAEVEASLRTAIKLNPTFAPAYDQLAVFYGMRREKLDEAHLLNLQAAQLDPGNLGYRMNAANVLMTAGRYKDAIAGLQLAVSIAKTPEEVASVQNRIAQIQQYQAGVEQAEQANRRAAENAQSHGGTGLTGPNPPPPKYSNEAPHGPRHTANGVIRDVRCTMPSLLELKIEDSGKGVSLYSNNYFKIEFTAANFRPQGDMHPCTDLEGMKARVQYSETSNKSVDGQILSIELSQ
jgi:tetratricopeptide (TPR) repeat protein